MKEYDVVVIGAGNGGLTAAIRVLQGGASCLLAERHNLPGGFATSFKRGRFEFEASLHELNDLGTDENPGDVLNLFKDLGVTDRLNWVSVPDAYRVICKNENVDVLMPFGVKEYVDCMEKYCPGSRESVEKFFELCEEIAAAQAYMNSVDGEVDSKLVRKQYPNFLTTGSYSVNEVLRTMKMPKKAIDVLEAYWCYLGADCDNLSFAHYASMVIRYLTKGSHFPTLKSHGLSLVLENRVRELGGDVWYNSEVERILTKNGKISGVRFSDGREVSCRHIIANCAPHTVYANMLPASMVPEAELRAVNSRKFAGRGFTLYLGLDKSAEELGIENHNYFLYDTLDTVKQYELMKKIETNNVQATVCLNKAYPDCSPAGTCMLYFTTLFTSDDWSKVSEEKYFETKEKYAAKMISNFEKATGVNLHDHIEEIAIATPETYARYCAHPQGGIYGYESVYWDGLMPRLMMMDEDNRVSGLRFCGGFAMRLSGYSSAYFSGDISGRQTVGDMKKGGELK